MPKGVWRRGINGHGAKHGMGGTPTYESWSAMWKRCRNPNHVYYYRYGGRGITVCERWRKFENFFADMGFKPKGMNLERKDTNGNYEPSNCKWATHKEQQNNRTNNVRLTYLGRTQTLTQWCEELGISRNAVQLRLGPRMRWNTERALSTPIQDNRLRKSK